ncbi:MAG TPA: DUF1345 domain-containing protein [Mycobacteriales bacterium]|nr:DUF1345 domain-containing protein [Mycobacteriales bacterium]
MRGNARRHVALVGLVGAVAGIVVALAYRTAVGVLAGYDAAALLYVGYVWWRIWPMDADATSVHAAEEDPTRASADVVLLLAAVISLGAVAWAIGNAHSGHSTARTVNLGLGVGSIVVSWLLVHTIFTLKYARLYYGGAGAEGGVDFEHKVRPPYSDFGYLAFTIGMTFQVSDTDLQTPAYRRLALRHALLSYLFGAVILASAVNLVANLAT